MDTEDTATITKLNTNLKHAVQTIADQQEEIVQLRLALNRLRTYLELIRDNPCDPETVVVNAEEALRGSVGGQT